MNSFKVMMTSLYTIYYFFYYMLLSSYRLRYILYDCVGYIFLHQRTLSQCLVTVLYFIPLEYEMVESYTCYLNLLVFYFLERKSAIDINTLIHNSHMHQINQTNTYIVHCI